MSVNTNVTVPEGCATPSIDSNYPAVLSARQATTTATGRLGTGANSPRDAFIRFLDPATPLGD
jgi:hypothetical protein